MRTIAVGVVVVVIVALASAGTASAVNHRPAIVKVTNLALRLAETGDGARLFALPSTIKVSSGYARVSVSACGLAKGCVLGRVVLRFQQKEWKIVSGWPDDGRLFASEVGCTAVSSKAVRGALKLGCSRDRPKSLQPQPKQPKQPAGDRWVLARDVETAFYENGVSGVKVTLVSCDGVGRAGPRINDEYGSPTTTYRIFTCYAIPSGQSTRIYRVDITSGSRAAGFRYSYLES